MSVTTRARFFVFALFTSITLAVAAQPIEAQRPALAARGTVSREVHGWSPQTNFTRLARSVAGGKNCKVTVEQLP